MSITFIYGLFDPRTCELKYIGKANNPRERLREHISTSRGKIGHGYRYNPNKEKWIRELLKDNLEPAIEILEECTEDNWQEIERAWIEEAREKGARLLNITGGGDGFGSGENHPMFGKKLTDDHKKKCSISLTGRKHTEETRKKIGRKGRILSKEHKEKISKNHANMSGENNPFYGKTYSNETKKKISQANTGRIRTLEQREKLGKWVKGQKWTAKLTKEQVIEIRAKWKSSTLKYGLLVDLSLEYKVNKTTIWLIVHNKTWKDI